MITVFGGGKGGSGKSTNCINFSVERINSGRDVMIIDTNSPQNSTMNWSKLRAERNILPVVTCIEKSGKTIVNELRQLSKNYDCFVDVGFYESIEFLSAISVADYLIAPIEASQFNIWTVTFIEERVSRAKIFNDKLKAFIFINKANPFSKEASEVISFIKNSGLKDCKLIDKVIYDRIAHRYMISEGRAITEYTPEDPKAIAEFKAVYKEIFNEH